MAIYSARIQHFSFTVKPETVFLSNIKSTCPRMRTSTQGESTLRASRKLIQLVTYWGIGAVNGYGTLQIFFMEYTQLKITL